VEYLGKDSAGNIPTSQDVIEMFSLRWWHRVWVLQEIAVAKRGIVLCGNQSCTWDELISNADIFKSIRAAGQEIPFPAVFKFGLRSIGSKNSKIRAGNLEIATEAPKVRVVLFVNCCD
jgi:hypothetical protein